MSYDLWLETPPGKRTCEHCGSTIEGEDVGDLDWNYTSNCAWMWREAGADLASFDGDPAGECAPLLKAAIGVLEARRKLSVEPQGGAGFEHYGRKPRDVKGRNERKDSQ